jgi:hypothetical protein
MTLESLQEQLRLVTTQRDELRQGLLDAQASDLAKSQELGVLRAQIALLESVKKSWWPMFREELAKPEYQTFVQAKDATGLYQYLTNENIEIDLDPIPAPIVRSAISGVLAEIALHEQLDANTKTTWRNLLLDQLQALGDNAREVPAVLVQALVTRAINAGILPAGTKIGIVLTSRLKMLGFADRIKTAIDIAEAMGWGPTPPAPEPIPSTNTIAEGV